LSAKKDFWDDPEKARSLLQKKTRLSASLEQWKRFNGRVGETENLWRMAFE
jgi:hypothetical protein